jgi:hypothetical protein
MFNSNKSGPPLLTMKMLYQIKSACNIFDFADFGILKVFKFLTIYLFHINDGQKQIDKECLK